MTLAWHFLLKNKLRDGRRAPKDGKALRHDGPVSICNSGLHASRRLLDALQYAPGTTLCRVQVADIVEEQEDKLVARERTILWRMEASDVLRAFARRCAVDALPHWRGPVPDVVRKYLKSGDPKLRSAAWSAAGSAAESAAGSAAWSAAWSAARSAARSAAWSAAESAAESAAWSAAESAAWSAAWSAAGSAAWSAAWSAAESAAKEKQERRLIRMVNTERRNA